MTTEPFALLFNPTAGRGRAARHLSRMMDLFEEAGVSTNLWTSRGVGELEQKAFELISSGTGKILVAGGDGSIHEAVNGIMRANTGAGLGVIPCGTGNDFAKACSIPLDWEHATRLLANRLATNSPPRRIDVGRMNERYFANGAGIGLDAKITRIARSIHWPIGDFVYLFAIFRGMIDAIATPEVTISAGDVLWRGPLTLANISNGPWVGGMFHIAPMAKNDDGHLDLIIAGPVSRKRILRLIPKLIRGRHLDEPEITHVGLQRVRIEASEPVPSHLDGEVLEPGKSFDFEILPGALDLL
jgi:diacylglycerol kinase (ATP)